VVGRIKRAILTTLVVLGVNFVLAVTKLVAGLVGNSYALVADAIESFADIGSSVIVWGGLAFSAKPADEHHPYGHGRAESLAGLAVPLMLAGAAVGIVIQAIREIVTPHHIPAVFTLWVLAGVVATKEVMYRVVRRVGNETGSRAMQAEAWHHRSDALTSLAAGVGISMSVLLGPGYESADDWAALFVSGIILLNAYRLFKRALGDLMDEDVSQELRSRVQAAAAAVSGVSCIEKLLARRTGLWYLVDMHVEVDGQMTVRASHQIAHDLKDEVMRAIPEVADVLIHIEPAGGVRADAEARTAR